MGPFGIWLHSGRERHFQQQPEWSHMPNGPIEKVPSVQRGPLSCPALWCDGRGRRPPRRAGPPADLLKGSSACEQEQGGGSRDSKASLIDAGVSTVRGTK